MNYALLLLAGTSSRFKNKTPKQFYLYHKKPLYLYPLMTLVRSTKIDGVILITNKNHVMDVYQTAKRHHLSKVKAVIQGGNSRNESVRLGLIKLSEFAKDDDLVLIHDAARVLLIDDDIAYALKETKNKGATTFALHSFDTLVRSHPNYQVKEYIDRMDVFRLQTPQTFKFGLIKDAYLKQKGLTFDDTELAFRLKKQVHLLKGNERLFKITNTDDLIRLEAYKRWLIK